MEKHIETCLNRLSLLCISIATILLLCLYLKTPQTCVPSNLSKIEPHHKFPSSTCDSSLKHRPHLSLSAKNRRLWSSKSWKSQVSSYKTFFSQIRHLDHLHNHSRVLCLAAGAGHEVMALSDLGVSDVTGVEIVDSLPLVTRVDLNDLPFFDGAFDFVFSGRLIEALFPLRFVGEIERVLRGGGVCVVVVEECGRDEVNELVGLFQRSEFLRADNVTLIGVRMTRIIMRTWGFDL